MPTTPTTPVTAWEYLKQRILGEINVNGKLFINPRSNAKKWQAAMELVGKAAVTYDGCYFYKKGA